MIFVESEGSDDGSYHSDDESSKPEAESAESSDQDSEGNESEAESEQQQFTLSDLTEMANGVKQNDTASKVKIKRAFIPCCQGSTNYVFLNT